MRTHLLQETDCNPWDPHVPAEAGTADEFVRAMREESVPLLERAGFPRVDCGASLVAEGGHEEAYLIRAVASLEEHHGQEQAFGGLQSHRELPDAP